MDRWIENDVATTLPLDVFTQRNFDADFLWREVEFYWHKQWYRVFVPPFGGLKGNVHGSSMARWKARGRLLSANWTFFASYARLRHYEPILVEISLFERGWVTLNANFRGKGASPPSIFGIRKLDTLGYRMVKKIAENFNRLSRVYQRHRQTDGTAIAYSERERKYHVR